MDDVDPPGQKAPAKAPVQPLISRSPAGIICWGASWELADGNWASENGGLTTFHLEHRQTGDTQVLGGWGYIWGALLGPMYVLVKGFPGQALLMLLLSGLIFATIGILAVLVALWSDSSAIRILSFAALLGLGLAVHGYFAVELTRRGFLRLGYREGYY
jgi:hypothetical protein